MASQNRSPLRSFRSNIKILGFYRLNLVTICNSATMSSPLPLPFCGFGDNNNTDCRGPHKLFPMPFWIQSRKLLSDGYLLIYRPDWRTSVPNLMNKLLFKVVLSPYIGSYSMSVHRQAVLREIRKWKKYPEPIKWTVQWLNDQSGDKRGGGQQGISTPNRFVYLFG